jgi:hypothetical protein
VSSDPNAPSDPAADVGSGSGAQPSEAELRAAYEAELARITSTDLMLQSTVSLLNVGSYRLMGSDPAGPAGGGRDLEQVRDAIDGVRALMEILERRVPSELLPLRDALSQLQMAYAREMQAGGAGAGAPGSGAPGGGEPGQGGGEPGHGGGGQAPGGEGPGGSGLPGSSGGASGGEGGEGAGGQGSGQGSGPDEQGRRGPGPAESSGRLWVPGR